MVICLPNSKLAPIIKGFDMKSKHTYHIEKPLSRHVEQNLQINLDVQIQVIVCGLYASHFLSGINNGKLEFNEEEKYPAFIYSVKGRKNIHAQLDFTSTINYTEIRRKKASPTRENQHEDHFMDKTQSTQMTCNNFQNTNANFKSSNTTWIVLAAADVKEKEALLKDIIKLMDRNKFKMYELTTELKSAEMNVNHFPTSCVYYISHTKDITNAAKAFEERLKNDIEEDLKTHEKSFINHMKTNTKNEIVQEIHQEADKYFQSEDKEKCLVM